MAWIANINSNAPAAPNVCPIVDLFAQTYGLYYPNTFFMELASI